MTKRKSQGQLPKDPHFEREAQRYEKPIASRELILETLAEAGSPLEFDEIAVALSITDAEALEALRRRLRAMERDGQALCNRRGAYLPVKQADLMRGRVIGHADGFGFLVPDDQSEDLFLSSRQMRGILHGDRVLARVVGVDHRGRREGAVIELLERSAEQLVGRIRVADGVGIVQPDNKRITHDILVPPDGLGAAEDGQIVVIRLRPQVNRKDRLRGEVIEVLGEHMAPGMEIDIAIRAHGLPFLWTADVTEAADRLGGQVPRTASRGRLDLRKKPLVTIDGEDARDFDDALFCEETEQGWRLWVAIADVSHYVEKDSPLDLEAKNRGTSVYFPSQVIPMLPEVLSNGLCSLNPDVDRLCMVCEVEIGKRGALRKFEFHEGIMRSQARLTYTEVAAMLVDQEPELRARHAVLLPHLERLHALFKALHGARNRRGAIDFDSVETRIEFGSGRKIERIVPVIRNDAHRLVEECMIVANVCAARFLKKHKVPALYRLHDRPPARKLDDLRDFLAGVGLQLEGGEQPEPGHYAAVLRAASARPDQQLIQTVVLRSLSQAVYGPALSGHFGLALQDYAHFTSPIRRYPDLLVHRAIRHILRRGKPSSFPYSLVEMEALGEHCSLTERRADDATRDAISWLKAEYMEDKVGDIFAGIVSGVTGFGLFVEIEDVFIEGLVHVTSLDNDYYHFDPVRHRLTGQRSGRRFGIGDRLQVQVIRVSLDDRKIDLRLVDEQEASGPRRRAGRSDPAASAAGKAGKAVKEATKKSVAEDAAADGVADGSKVPKISKAAEAAGVADGSMAPKISKATEATKAAKAPEAAEVAGVKDDPDASEVSDVSEVSDISEVSEVDLKKPKRSVKPVSPEAAVPDAPDEAPGSRRSRRRRQGFQMPGEVALLVQRAPGRDAESQSPEAASDEVNANSEQGPDEPAPAQPRGPRRRRRTET